MTVPIPLAIAFLLSVLNLAYVWRLRAAAAEAAARIPGRHVLGSLLSLSVLLALVPLVGFQVGWAAALLVLPLGGLGTWALSRLLPSPTSGLYRTLLATRHDPYQLSERREVTAHQELASTVRVIERGPRPARVIDRPVQPVPRARRSSPHVVPAVRTEPIRPPLWAGMERYRLHCRACGRVLTKAVRELDCSMPAFFYGGELSTSHLRVCQPRAGAFWRSRSNWDSWEGRCVLGGVRFGSDGEVLLLSHADLEMDALGPEQLPGSGGCCGYYGGAGPNCRCAGCDELVVTYVADCEAPEMAAASLAEVELRLEWEEPYSADASPGQQ